MIVFAYPLFFILLLLPFVFYEVMPSIKGLYGDALRIPFIADLKRISIISGKIWQPHNIANIRFSFKFMGLYLVWALLCVALARPQVIGEPVRLQNESRDIMLVLDISTSMLERDFSYNGHRISRIDAVKKVVSDFADKRANDRLGLILFGTRAYLQAPLTFDKASLKDILWSMQAGMAGDSTSIGDALALALKTMSNKSGDKAIILLTDGENNDGSLSLGQAIKLAADENIKTYTIGVGSPNVFFKMISLATPGLDEQGLKQLAQLTEGKYFRAESTSDLQKVYQIIDSLEASKADEQYIQETTEFYWVPLLIAAVLAMVFVFIWQRKDK